MTRDWSHLRERPPLGQLSPDPWLAMPSLRRLIGALRAAGADVRLVGGCVRDGLLRRPVDDIDLATPARPEEVRRIVEAAGFATVPWTRGLAHGTVLTVVDGTPYEVTTLRRDVACDGRHAEVVFTDDWMADAARRDFTMNALSATPDGSVYDYFDGIADLSEGRVRFVGRAIDRIAEDALRILRFFRFHAHYGQAAPDRDGFKACQAQAETVLSLSGERVRTELLKILMAPDPAGAMLLLRGAHVLPHVLPEAERVDVLRILAFLETRGVVAPGIGPDGLRRLAAVMRVDAGGAARAAQRLRLSRAESRRLEDILTIPEARRPHAGLDGPDRRRLLDRLGPALFLDLCLVDWAAERAACGHTDSARTRGWLRQIEEATGFAPPPFPISGTDLLAAGLPKGPAVGRAMAALRDWWLAEAFRPDREDLLARLRDLGVAGQAPGTGSGRRDGGA